MNFFHCPINIASEHSGSNKSQLLNTLKLQKTYDYDLQLIGRNDIKRLPL